MNQLVTNKFALIYPRVSSERQVAEGHGLQSQTQRCVKYAQEKGYRVHKIFPEEGVSGGLFERPMMKELLNCIEELKTGYPGCDVVVIFDDIKRFARDLEIHFKLKSEIYGRGATLESPNFVFDESPEGKFVEQMMAAQSELERNQNKRQVIQKMRARLELGYWPFYLPPGYINEKHPEHGKIAVPTEPFTSIFRSAIEGFATRRFITQAEVGIYINKEYQKYGLSKRIALHGVQSLLTNPFYAGIIDYPKWSVTKRQGKHQAIIAIETYNHIQSILHDRFRPRRRIDTRVDFPLRNLVVCSGCYKPLTASWNTGRKGKRYPNYFCKTPGCQLQNKCIQRQIIEDHFLSRLHELTLDSSMKSLINYVFRDSYNEYELQNVNNKQINQHEIEQIDISISRLTSRITKTTDEVLIQAYESELSKLGKKKEQLQSITFPNSFTEEELGTALSQVLNILENPVSTWKNGDLQQKHMIFYMFYSKKPAYDRLHGFGTATLDESVNLIHSIGTGMSSLVEMPGNEPGSECEQQQHLHV